MSLRGRVALVTGGGRGIGAAVAEQLAKQGARVAVAARSESQVKRVADRLRRGGAKAVGLVADVSSEGEVACLVSETASRLGPVDVLVCNAGVATSAPLVRTSLEQWNKLMQVNATGPFLCMREVLPGMNERGWGRIVVVASVAGLAGARYIAAYAASKHAAVGLVRVAALEHARKGVTVNAVCPGFVDTEMTEETLTRIERTAGLDREKALASLVGDAPLGRLIEPAEVAHAVVGLCVPESGAVNGQCLVVDGGELQR